MHNQISQDSQVNQVDQLSHVNQVDQVSLIARLVLVSSHWWVLSPVA